jgi:hypothetical protein
VSDIVERKVAFEDGLKLAELCRRHAICPEWMEHSGDLDRLVALVLEDCERRLRDLPEPVYEAEGEPGAERRADDGMEALRRLVAFARAATALRGNGHRAFALVSGVDDLERIRQEGLSGEDPRESEQVRERALELCGQIGQLCHKINNPLTSLMGRAQMIGLVPDPTKEKLAQSVRVIDESARRVTALVQELSQLVGRTREALLQR